MTVHSATRLLLCFCTLALAGCAGAGPALTGAVEGGGENDPKATPAPIRFLALGDSYTIGESVEATDRWPVQLADLLRPLGYPVLEPQIVARTGWTTTELMGGMDAAGLWGPFDLVSLLIGVNNQYRGLEIETYRSEFRLLLERAIALADGEARRVLVLSIPDWGVTPFAERWDRDLIASEIDRYNRINREEAVATGAHYVDVTPISRTAADSPSLLAPDGLHPAREMYRAWAELALPAALEALRGGSDNR